MKCCICGKEIEGFGNNPWPINNDVEAKCCDDCNWGVVIPARIDGLYRKEGRSDGKETKRPFER